MRSLVMPAAIMMAISGPALAGTNLVVNGDFVISTNQTTSSCQLSYNCMSTGWSGPGGYNFIFLPGTATSTGAVGVDGPLALWGAANGGSSTWDGNAPAAITGSNFLAADGAYGVVAVTQTVTGLTPGDHYALTFYWAGAQQTGYYSSTTEQWVVSLGGQTFQTAVVQNNPQGFTGWMTEDFTYTATAATEILSFLAVGTPGASEPPFSLLAGVSLEDMPEPGSVAVVAAGLLGLLALRRTRSA